MRTIRFWKRVHYKTEGLRVSTEGLHQRGQADLTILVDSSDLVQEAQFFLMFVVEYLESSRARITAHQTLNYGYWLVKFEPIVGGLLDVWEYDPEMKEFGHGGSLALRYWREQHEICEKAQASFAPPYPEKLTSVSAGVMEGQPAEGVRYHIGEPMSGWIIVTDQYDGNIQSLTNHHTYHITAARPDLAKFLALPCGFRFNQTKGEQVWFDPEVASQLPV